VIWWQKRNNYINGETKNKIIIVNQDNFGDNPVDDWIWLGGDYRGRETNYSNDGR
jgi:hypothetical protein